MNIHFDVPIGFWVFSYNQNIYFSLVCDKILDFMDPKEFIEEMKNTIAKEFLKE